MKRLIALIIQNAVLANVLMVMIIAMGLMAGFNMLRLTFPEVSMDTITVTIVYPGADVEEVEEGISRKVEEAVDGLEGVTRYTTISSEGTSRAVIEVDPAYPIDKARRSIKNAVDTITTFPQVAERPIVEEVWLRPEVLLLSLWGNMEERTRKELAEEIKNELQALPGLSQVTISGVREYEITVEVSESRLQEYGLTFEFIAQLLREGSVNRSGGFLRTSGERIDIRTVGRKYTGQEIASIVVLALPNGDLVTMDRIATIRDSFEEDPIIARFNGEPGVLIGLYKTSEEDTISISKAGHAYAKRKQAMLPEGIHLTAWSDSSVVIDDRLRITMKNGAVGLLVVLFFLWLFMDSRLSFWVAMGIPISLCGSLIVMNFAGMTLNSVTLFGLVMVTGIVVDDAIIVAEAIYLRRAQGDSPVLAAVNGVTEVGLPVLAAVTTTVVAFLPLGFISGTMGKFMATMAIAVIGALLVSLVEALFILPAHLCHLPDPNRQKLSQNPIQRLDARFRKMVGRTLDWATTRVYQSCIRIAIRNRYVILSAAFAVLLVTAGILGGGFIEFTIFPQGDENQIEAVLEFPQGTPATVTEVAVRQTEEGLRRVAKKLEAEGQVNIVEHVYTVVGEGPSGDGQTPTGGGTHLGKVRVQIAHSNVRDIHSQDIMALWQKEVGDITGTLSQTFSTVGGGGPGGAAIDIWLQGEDTPTLLAVAEEVKDQLRSYDGVYQVQDSFRPGKRELAFNIKPEARSLGITLEDVAQQVYAGFYGVEATRIQRGRDDIRIKVRYADTERSAMSKLDDIRIRAADGHEVPFFSVANVKFDAGPAVIERADGRRRVSVSAEIDENVANSEEISADMVRNFFPEIMKNYPGVTVAFEGSQEERRDSVRSLMLLFPVAMLGVFMIIATIFRSYLQPLVVMATVPLGIVGAIFGHLFMGLPIVMFSIFGMMALTGVVVNDAIVLMEAINNQIAKGTPFIEAIVQGGMRRLRAIILTTVSTVGALIPLIIETDLSAQPLKPMALSVASGVAFATVLTLVLIPCLFAILNDFRRIAHFMANGKWPTRDEVEPARTRGIDPYQPAVNRPAASGAVRGDI